MSDLSTLGEFTGDDGSDAEAPEEPPERELPECRAAGCEGDGGGGSDLCLACQNYGQRDDAELVERESDYEPDGPRCGYCGRLVRPEDHPRRCPACGPVDANEVVGV